MMKLYWCPRTRSFTALWLMEETGQPYERVLTDISTGAQRRAEYLAINPMGKVPAIRHGDVVVTEAAAICAYLADAFPDAGLAPPTDARGAYYRWLFFTAGPLEAAVTNRALGVEVPDERRGMVGYGDFGRVMDALESAVAGRAYVAGDRFTAADVYVGAQLSFGLRFGSIEDRPAFRAYSERLAARPAAIRAQEIDNAAMPKREG